MFPTKLQGIVSCQVFLPVLQPCGRKMRILGLWQLAISTILMITEDDEDVV